jgi:UMF1 family MFS transporter
MASATAIGTAPAPRRAVAAWVLYDLANVAFSINIISLYFPLWVVDDAGGRDSDYGLASAASMALVLLAAPFLGALSDQSARRLPFLAVATAVCCGATLFLGSGGLLWSLVWFAVANAFFQSGLVFYDALLPTVSTPETVGRVSGWGIGAGFAGALLGIGLGLTVLRFNSDAKPLVFKLTAVLFALGALPCFLWVRERPGLARPASAGRAVRQTMAELRATPALLRSAPGLGRYLVGRIFYTDAGNTAVAFMGVYAAKELGFSDLQTQLVLLAGIVAGPVGALTGGRWVDRLGPRRTLHRMLALWAAVLLLAAIVPAAGLPTGLFWLVAPLVGVALGGTSATDRTYLLRLAPPGALGQCYGLYATVGRFAAITGPLLWAAVVDWVGWGRPAAVASLAGMVIIGAAILRPVTDRPRTWGAEEVAVAADEVRV